MKTQAQTPSISAITLGTVQLGQAYGVANTDGMPADHGAFAILDAAWNGGVRSVDTARAYGLAEARIGAWMEKCGFRPWIVTKVAKVAAEVPCDKAIQASVTQSMTELAVDYLDGLMMHSAADLFRRGGIEMLNRLIADGSIGGFGISAYSPQDVDRALDVPGLSMVQVPFNLFDRRMETSGVLARCQSACVTVFVRSVFLQGLFFLDPDRLPSHLQLASEPLRRLRAFADEHGRSVAELALAAVKATPGVSSIVVGAERPEQIREILDLSQADPLASDAREAAYDIGAHLPEQIYHPGLWAKPKS